MIYITCSPEAWPAAGLGQDPDSLDLAGLSWDCPLSKTRAATHHPGQNPAPQLHSHYTPSGLNFRSSRMGIIKLSLTHAWHTTS